MKDEALIIIVCALCGIAGYIGGRLDGERRVEREAVSKGAAHWEATGPNETKLVWKN